MFRIDDSFFVLAYIGIWLAFGRSQHDMHRHQACPFLLLHNKGFQASDLGCGVEVLSGLSYLSGFSRLIV
jgi:hypothetical protein